MFSWAEQIISGMSRCFARSRCLALSFSLCLSGSAPCKHCAFYFGSFAGIATIGIGISIGIASIAIAIAIVRLRLRRRLRSGSGMGWKNVLYRQQLLHSMNTTVPLCLCPPLPLSAALPPLSPSLSPACLCLALYAYPWDCSRGNPSRGTRFGSLAPFPLPTPSFPLLLLFFFSFRLKKFFT